MSNGKSLGIIRGSVRALIALMLIGTVCFMLIAPYIVGPVETSGEILATVSALAGAVTGYYFKSMDDEAGNEANSEKNSL